MLWKWVIKVSTKLGRPTNDPKDFSMRVRLSADHKKKLETVSSKTGKTKSDIIREGIDVIYNNLEGK